MRVWSLVVASRHSNYEDFGRVFWTILAFPSLYVPLHAHWSWAAQYRKKVLCKILVTIYSIARQLFVKVWSRSLLEDLLNVLTCVHQRILRPWRFYVDFLNNFGLSFAMWSAACALELGYTVSRKESYVKFMRQSTQLLGVLCVRGCSRSLLEDLLNVLTRVRGYSVLNFSKIIEF